MGKITAVAEIGLCLNRSWESSNAVRCNSIQFTPESSTSVVKQYFVPKSQELWHKK